MKKLFFLSLLGAIGFFPYHAAAQISVSLNIGSQPLWGPVGYDYVDYYYLPEIECYYNVPNRQFIYMDNGRWNFSLNLPSRYRSYDLYRGYKVVVNSRNPYNNFHNDRVTYSRYRNVHTQTVIRYSRDPRYYVVKGHPNYGRGNDRDDRRGYDRGRNDNNGRGNDKDWGRGNDGRPGRGDDKDHGRGRDNDRGGRDNDRGGHDRGRGRH